MGVVFLPVALGCKSCANDKRAVTNWHLSRAREYSVKCSEYISVEYASSQNIFQEVGVVENYNVRFLIQCIHPLVSNPQYHSTALIPSGGRRFRKLNKTYPLMNSLYDAHSFMMRLFIQIKLYPTFSTSLWEKKTIVLIIKQIKELVFRTRKW